MNVPQPYLLFLADETQAKTAEGVRYWRPEACVGQLRYAGSTLDLRLPEMTLAEAAAAGVQTLLIGAAPVGGVLPRDRKRVGAGKSVAVRVGPGGRRRIKKKKTL